MTPGRSTAPGQETDLFHRSALACLLGDESSSGRSKSHSRSTKSQRCHPTLPSPRCPFPRVFSSKFSNSTPDLSEAERERRRRQAKRHTRKLNLDSLHGQDTHRLFFTAQETPATGSIRSHGRGGRVSRAMGGRLSLPTPSRIPTIRNRPRAHTRRPSKTCLFMQLNISL